VICALSDGFLNWLSLGFSPDRSFSLLNRHQDRHQIEGTPPAGRCGSEERRNVASTPNDTDDFDVMTARAVENDERPSGERTEVASEFGAKPSDVSMEGEQLALFVDRIDEAICRSEALRPGDVLGEIINVGIGCGSETEPVTSSRGESSRAPSCGDGASLRPDRTACSPRGRVDRFRA
jgi:hypothetical protein